MTASKEAIKAGFESLKEVELSLGTKPDGNPVVSRQTLDGWFKNKRILFDTVLGNVPKGRWIDTQEYKPVADMSNGRFDLVVIQTTNGMGLRLGYILQINVDNHDFIFYELGTNHRYSSKVIEKLFVLPENRDE